MDRLGSELVGRIGSGVGVNPLVGRLKLQSNGPLYSNTVIGTLAVDGWVLLHVVQRGGAWAGCGPVAVPDVTAHPSTVSVPTSYYSVWQYNCLSPLKG